jgi:hypothetical protein
MDKIIVDPALQKQLRNLDHALQVCNTQGQTLGYFLTEADFYHWLSQLAFAKTSEEDLDRIENSPGEKSTAEVLARLEQL